MSVVSDTSSFDGGDDMGLSQVSGVHLWDDTEADPITQEDLCSQTSSVTGQPLPPTPTDSSSSYPHLHDLVRLLDVAESLKNLNLGDADAVQRHIQETHHTRSVDELVKLRRLYDTLLSNHFSVHELECVTSRIAELMDTLPRGTSPEKVDELVVVERRNSALSEVVEKGLLSQEDPLFTQLIRAQARRIRAAR